MKIRSITCFAPGQGPESGLAAVAVAGRFLREARGRFEAAGYVVQSVRLALPALGRLLGPEADPDALIGFARELETRGEEAGIGYLSCGPLRAGDPAEWSAAVPEALHATERVFLTLEMADPSTRRVDFAQVRAAARCIVENAPLRPDGFVNLRFAALANVRPGVPFLPAAHSSGEGWSYALATESADLARRAFAEHSDLESASEVLVASVESHAARLESAAARLAASHPGVEYGGADFSLAPYPRDADSIGATLESMGSAPVGRPGTTFRAAALTSSLDRARYRRAGFSGLFLPVLEDDRLALRAGEGTLRLEDLMLACTVCGTGLDTVPLPGDARAEDLEPWLLDLCALSLRLDKPLTARLMPMPGRSAGDAIEFDFPFFAPGTVLDLPRGTTPGGDAKGSLPLVPYHTRDREASS